MPPLPHAIPLDNASNLRDLGGWPTIDGRRVRRGLVYRAPALINLSDKDLATIAALGIRTSCDFRGVRESAANPVQLAGATVNLLPIEPSVGAGLRDILRTGQMTGHVTAADMLALLREAYVAYALTSFAQYHSMFALLAGDEHLPLLIHCSAGKDRTGFGAALLLTALGVAWPHVMQDYLATNTHWKREIAGFFDLPAPVKDTLLSAHEPLLTAAFDAIRAQYGSVDAYLTRAIGLDPQARTRLADRLLEG
jgi:protein-tyrosine phosphatase